jgi:AcrR family transcriptional regulator
MEASSSPPDQDGRRPLIDRAISRTIAGQYEAAAADIDALIEATYRVIERDGNVNPRVRDIIDEAGSSRKAFYRHFSSKDELMLVLLDDGRHRHASYLRHRMSKATTPIGQVREWIEGTFAQASDPAAAARTRPFAASHGHLREQYPDEHRASVQLLVSLLEEAIAAAAAAGDATTTDPAADATSIYLMVQGLAGRHLLDRTTPTRPEIDHTIAFALAGIGAG